MISTCHSVYLFYHLQYLHHLDVPCGDVHRAIYMFGSAQPSHLHPDPESQHGTRQAVQTSAEGDRNGYHAHLCSHGFLRLQCFGSCE